MTEHGDLADRLAAAEVVARCMCWVDRGRWQDLAALLAPVVFLDYTSLRPAEPAAMRDAADVIASWRDRHAAIAAYQHHLGAIVADVRGERATCQASGLAVHRRTAPDGATTLWQLGVAYDWELRRSPAGWRIAAMTATRLWERRETLPA